MKPLDNKPPETVVTAAGSPEGDALEAALPKSSFPQRVIERLSKALFLPAQYDFSSRLRKPWFVISILLLLVLAAMSLPPVQSFILYTYPNYKSWLIANSRAGKLWLESVSIFLEIGIAICLGGSIIGTALTLTEPIKSTIDGIQKDLDRSIKSRAQNLEEYFKTLPDETAGAFRQFVKSLDELRIRTGYLNYFKSYIQLVKLAWDFVIVIRSSLPVYAQNLVTVKLLTSFPGGLFGFLTYVLFLVLVVIKVFKLFFDAVG